MFAKRLSSLFLATAIMAMVAGGVQAAPQNLVTNGDFEAFTGAFPQNDFRVNDATTHNKWLQQGHWSSVFDGLSNNYASHALAAPSHGTTDQLFQGIVFKSLAGVGPCIKKGWKLRVDFRYINEDFPSDTLPPSLVAYGFTAGGVWSRFAPWPVTNGTLQASQTYPRVNVWTGQSLFFTLTDDFPALAVGFRFGYQGAATIDRKEWLDDVALVVDTFPAAVRIEPETLNVKSKGGNRSMTAFIGQFPRCFSVVNIDPTTVKLTAINGNLISPIPATPPPVLLGKNELMAKFDRQALIAALGSITGEVSLTVEGALKDGTMFEATDTIKVIHP